MEYAAEKEAYRQQTEQMGVLRQVKRGDAWWPVRMGKSYYNSLNQLVVEVHRQGDDDEIEHNFEFGRPVAFFRSLGDPKKDLGNPRENLGKPRISYFPFTGTVSFVDGDRMVVAVPDNGQLIDVQGAENVGVQLYFDETSYKMMFEALDRVMRAKGRLAYLRDLFYSPSKGEDHGGGMRAETFTFAPEEGYKLPWFNAGQHISVKFQIDGKWGNKVQITDKNQ